MNKKTVIVVSLVAILTCGGVLFYKNMGEGQLKLVQVPNTTLNSGIPAQNDVAGQQKPQLQYDLKPYSDNGAWGYIDKKSGAIVVRPQYVRADDYAEGRALVGLKDKQFAYLDQVGQVVIEPFNAEYASSFSEGLAARGDRSTGEYIDINGKVVIALSCGANYEFHDGLARIAIGDNLETYGFIDKSGKWIIAPQFEYLGDFSESLAVAKSGGKAGFIDKGGNWIIPTQFDGAESFSYGLAIAIKGDKFGYIDKTGQWVIPPQFDDAHFFTSEGLAEVLIGKSWYHIDRTGNTVDKFYTIN